MVTEIVSTAVIVGAIVWAELRAEARHASLDTLLHSRSCKFREPMVPLAPVVREEPDRPRMAAISSRLPHVTLRFVDRDERKDLHPAQTVQANRRPREVVLDGTRFHCVRGNDTEGYLYRKARD